MSTELLIESIGAVRTLTLNRPERLNALTPGLLAALLAAVEDAAADNTVRAVLLTGAGRGFCTGADVAQAVTEARLDFGAEVERSYNPLVRAMRALPKPIIAAVNGVAAGAGMNLALAADIIIAARSANFTQAFVRVGLMPDAGGSFFLPRLVGLGRARALAMLGETITAGQAEAMGLVWKLFDDEVFATEALTMATNLAAKPAEALAAIKQALDAAASNTLEAQLALERDLQRRLGATEDVAEGVRAFLEKRPAVFNREK